MLYLKSEVIDGKTIGFYVIDIHTKKRTFISFYDLEKNILDYTILKFDLRDDKDQINRLLNNNPSITLPEDLSLNIKKDFLYASEKHITYCNKNGFNVTNFRKNINSLAFYCNTSINDIKYNTINNAIKINFANQNYKNLLRYIFLHELGHMKVTDFFLDYMRNRLIIESGFIKNIILDLKPICQIGDSIIYKYKIKNDSKKEWYALEEIANDIECLDILPTYSNSHYLKFAKLLKNICGTELIQSRYSHNLDSYFKALNKIIPSKYLASELLDLITKSLYGNTTEVEECTEKSLILLKKYSAKKK